MYKFYRTLLTFLAMPLLTPISHAVENATTQSIEALIARSAAPVFAQSSAETPATPVPNRTAPPTPSVANQEKSRMLPFWGDAARTRGYELPEPFGISINYMNIHQNIHMDSINFNGLALNNLPIPSDIYQIDVSQTRQTSQTATLKLDAWVLSFLNLYGIFGRTEGRSLSKVSVDGNTTKYGKNHELSIVAEATHDLYEDGNLKDLEFRLDFKGNTYGVGIVLVGGYENFFTLLDTNYTETQFDVLDGRISALVISPRIGYRFNVPAVDILHLKPSRLNVWVGSMYQDIQQEFKGRLSGLNMPSMLAGLMKVANENDQGRFNVKQHLQSPWNVLMGAQYEITKNFNVISELGFAKRNSFFVSGEYRF